MTKEQKAIEEKIRILEAQVEHLEKQIRGFLSVLEQHQRLLEENDTVFDK